MATHLITWSLQGLVPEIVPSTFEENLPKSEFIGEAVYEYPVQTGSKKALEVYKRLVVSTAGPEEFLLHRRELASNNTDPKKCP